MACQDLCTLAECIIWTNQTTNFSEIEDFCQNQDEKLLTTRNKDKKSSQYQHLQRMVHQNISIKMFLQADRKQITANDYPPRQMVSPANCYMTTNSYQETYQALTLFLAVKTSTELKEYTSQQKLTIQCTYTKDFAYQNPAYQTFRTWRKKELEKESFQK